MIQKTKFLSAFFLIFLLVGASIAGAWDVVIKDKWDELFRFNKIHEDVYSILYDGEWEWRSPINDKTKGIAAAAYIKEGTALSMAGWYGDGDTGYYLIYPYYAWYDNKKVYRWYGVKHWVRDTQYRENMYCDVVEGQIYWFTNVQYYGKRTRLQRTSGIQSLNLFNKLNPAHFDPLQDRSTIRVLPQSSHLKIGAMIPLTGNLESLGQSLQAALKLAEERLNQSFLKQEKEERVEIVIMDSETNPLKAGERLRELYEQGITVVLGPQTSELAQLLLHHANDNAILLMSSGSTAVDLAIPGDNLMRMMPDDTNQSRAVVDRLIADGITELFVLSRTDIYGSGISQAIADQFQACEGNTVSLLSFPTKQTVLDSLMQTMDTQIRERIDAIGADKVGICVILFEEGIEVLNRASALEGMKQVRWYGTDSLALNQNLISDSTASAFAAQTQFTCSAIAKFENDISGNIEAELTNRLGYEPNPVAMNMYDAAGLVTHALLNSNPQYLESVKSAINAISYTYNGATSPICFNANGDRKNGNYDYWKVSNENGVFQWKKDSTWQWTEPVKVINWTKY